MDKKFFSFALCEINEGEITSLYLKKDGVFYIFGSKTWAAVPEKHISLKASDLEDYIYASIWDYPNLFYRNTY